MKRGQAERERRSTTQLHEYTHALCGINSFVLRRIIFIDYTPARNELLLNVWQDETNALHISAESWHATRSSHPNTETILIQELHQPELRPKSWAHTHLRYLQFHPSPSHEPSGPRIP
jgi:hypothetical protein